MAIADAVLALEPWGGAVSIFQETGALTQCLVHPEIFVRIHDAGKERQAYELAETRLRSLPDDDRQAAIASMAASLNTTADRHCPLCSALIESNAMGRFQIRNVREYISFVEADLGPNVAAAILKERGGGVRDVNDLHPRHYDAVALACIDKLNVSEHAKKLRKENPWRLTVDHLRFVEATHALCAEWRHARTLATPESTKAYMLARFEEFKDVGTTSSETRGELYALLEECFPATGSG